MNNKELNGNQFAKMVTNGSAYLQINRKAVNDLNVFPVPDGDTGDNMYMTINAGVSELLGHNEESVGDVAQVISKGMLLGARGNSGVILSRIFAGISNGLKGLKTADVSSLHKVFCDGVVESYQAVDVPVEGTILTVFKDAVSYAGSKISKESTIDSFFNDLICELKKSLERTPDLLDVLKEAGVVDSGAAGLVYIIEGMKMFLDGKIIENDSIISNSSQTFIDVSLFTENDEMKYGYCTEILLRLQKVKTDIESFDLSEMKKYLSSIGDSLVAVKDGSIVKVHVHTLKPGEVLNYCQKFGEFLTIKIENMTLQHNETEGFKDDIQLKRKPHKKHAVISVANGDGLKEMFLSLGCDYVVDGGQSMNPSAESFINAFSEVNADTIFVLPNNGNIKLTAEQASKLYKDSKVIVIPSKTIGDGYAVMSQIDLSLGDDEIFEQAKEIMEYVTTGMVSKASRNTQKDGIDVIKDDYIGFSDEVIYSDDKNVCNATLKLAEKLNANNYDIMLLIEGLASSENETNHIFNLLEEKYKNTEIILVKGKQPIYDYIIVLE